MNRNLTIALFLFLAVCAAGWFVSASNAQAQTPPTVTIDAFEEEYPDLDYEMLVHVRVTTTLNWYARGRFGTAGTVVEGTAAFGDTDAPIIRIQDQNSGANMIINHSQDGFHFGDYFGGDGADLSLYIRTPDGDVVIDANDRGNTGGGFVNWPIPDEESYRDWISTVGTGDNVIVAFARPSGNDAPSFGSGNLFFRSVDEEQAAGANVGGPITATDDNVDTLSYSLGGSQAASFTVTDTGQIQTAVVLDYETESSYEVTLSATDGTDTTTVDVEITVNDVDELPALDPVPSSHQARTNLSFTVPSRPDITSFTVSEPTHSGQGDITIESTESALNCDSENNTLTSLSGGGTVWLRFCEEGEATVRVADGSDASVRRDYDFTITQRNRAPEFSANSYTRSVDENSDGGTNVGTPITADDADGDTLTYTLEGDDDDLFEIFSAGQITVADDADLDYEEETSRSVRIRATDPSGATDAAEVTININDVSENLVPRAPRNLTVDPGNNSLVLDWDEPADDGGSAITDYEYCSFAECHVATWRSLGSTRTSATITENSVSPFGNNLRNGVTYVIRVRAVNTVGSGAATGQVSGTPRAPSAPSAPSGFSATAGEDQVALSWTAPAVDHDETITRYDYSSDNGATWRSTGSTSSSYTATQTSAATPVNLSLGTEYTFRVRAVNSVGTGTQSASDAATPYGLPGAPGNLQGSAGDGQVALTWTGASANGQSITRYEYSSDNGTTWRTTGGTSTSYTATQTSAATPVNLVNDTSYTFRVRAVNSVGNGPQSNSRAVTPTASTVPGKVIGLSGTPGDGFVRLDWPAPDDGGTPITRYEYDAYLVSPGTWLSVGTATTVTVTQTTAGSYNMVNGYSFGFKVRAVNAIGVGPASDQLIVTPNNQPPAFSGSTASRSVDENEDIGTDVGSPITATDPESNNISYSITGTNTAGFTVTSGGQIQTGEELDHEATDSYTITLRAAATGGSDTISVTIAVNDVNEVPAFSSATASRSVAENSGANTNVGSAVTATDPDSGDSLSYTLYNGLGRFTIVSGTGQIRVASGTDLDYETTTSYDVTVRATDSGGLYDEISVTINVTNVTEAASLTGLSVPSATLTRITAAATATMDNDDGTDTPVYFRHRTPAGSGAWSTTHSESTTGTSVDYDMTGLTAGAQYRVQASLDSGFPSAGRQEADFTTTANVAPSFPASTATREVEENRLAGTNVGAPVTATDADGDTLTYTLGGTDASAFALDPATGQITVGSTTVFDYETKATYSVAVAVTDTFGATASVAVTIEVTDVREAGVLGRIVITVGGSGSNYGYVSGSYGTLDTGDFPGGLFGDGNSRTVAEIYEDEDGYWYFTYSGGLADDWLSDQEQLDEIVVEVKYQRPPMCDDCLRRDTRSFVLGGFIDSTPGSRGLKLDPPLPSRDWDSKDGEEVAFEFRRHRAQPPAPVLPPALTEPPAPPGTWADLLNSATGGPVDLQLMLTCLVWLVLLAKSPKGGWPLLVGLAAMVLTPWIPVAFNYGEYMLSTIVTLGVAATYFLQKFVTRQPQ